MKGLDTKAAIHIKLIVPDWYLPKLVSFNEAASYICKQFSDAEFLRFFLRTLSQ